MQYPDEPTQAMPAAEVDGLDGSTTAGGPAPSRPRPVVWVLSGLLVVALLAGVVWFAIESSRANREASIRDAATAYLTAVADGDAAGALALLAEPPTNTALLTDAVLAEAHLTTPLTEVQAGTLGGDDQNPTVDVTYRLGGREVATTLRLTGEGRTWKLADGTGDVVVPERRALTVNGVALTAETNPAFPGTYTAAPVNDKVQLQGEPTTTVAAPDQESARLDVTPALSEAGHQAVLNAVRTRYDACLTATDSRPANCPFGVSTEGVEVTEGSVRFVGTNDPWAAFAPTLNPDTLTAEGTISFAVNATATVTRDGLTLDAVTALSGERGYSVDLTQEPLAVTWR